MYYIWVHLGKAKKYQCLILTQRGSKRAFSMIHVLKMPPFPLLDCYQSQDKIHKEPWYFGDICILHEGNQQHWDWKPCTPVKNRFSFICTNLSFPTAFRFAWNSLLKFWLETCYYLGPHEPPIMDHRMESLRSRHLFRVYYNVSS
jgi:hypothetical protein